MLTRLVRWEIAPGRTETEKGVLMTGIAPSITVTSWTVARCTVKEILKLPSSATTTLVGN
eukprot:527907-Hanusia_phi.AAC.4